MSDIGKMAEEFSERLGELYPGLTETMGVMVEGIPDVSPVYCTICFDGTEAPERVAEAMDEAELYLLRELSKVPVMGCLASPMIFVTDGEDSKVRQGKNGFEIIVAAFPNRDAESKDLADSKVIRV